MKKCYFISLQAMLVFTYAQVGINTNSPNAMFEIASKPEESTIVDGFIPPRLDGEILKSKDALYETDQLGAILYVTEPVISSSPKTVNIISKGHYYFDGLAWQKLKSSADVTENIYTTDNILSESRVVDLGDKTLSFTSDAKKGTDHFCVDDHTFNVDAVNHRVGIGTDIPTAKLDVDGDLRVSDVNKSSDIDDIGLVVDDEGIIKKRFIETKGIFRAYLKNDVNYGDQYNRIQSFGDFTVVNHHKEEFNAGRFKPLVTGFYKVTYSVTATLTFDANNPVHYVFGLIDGSKWVMRYSVLTHNFPFDSKTGATYTFIGIVRLVAGNNYAFAKLGRIKLLANPEGTLGDSPASFFEIELVKKD